MCKSNIVGPTVNWYNNGMWTQGCETIHTPWPNSTLKLYLKEMARKKKKYKDGHRNNIYNTGKLENSQKFNNSVKAK